MELVSLFRTEPELSTDLDIDPFLFVSFFAVVAFLLEDIFY